MRTHPNGLTIAERKNATAPETQQMDTSAKYATRNIAIFANGQTLVVTDGLAVRNAMQQSQNGHRPHHKYGNWTMSPSVD